MLADLKWRVEQLAVSGAWCIARMHGKNNQESFTIAAGCFKDEETDLENYAKDLECAKQVTAALEQLAETAALALYGDCEQLTRQYTVDLVDQITRDLGLADAPEP